MDKIFYEEKLFFDIAKVDFEELRQYKIYRMKVIGDRICVYIPREKIRKYKRRQKD